jgi:hypothetical protein
MERLGHGDDGVTAFVLAVIVEIMVPHARDNTAEHPAGEGRWRSWGAGGMPRRRC